MNDTTKTAAEAKAREDAIEAVLDILDNEGWLGTTYDRVSTLATPAQSPSQESKP